MTLSHFDVVVIGAGPGGYVAALRCAQLGLKTACIDQFKNKAQKFALGGTCLNVGCIPSKALLESSACWERLESQISVHGITVGKSCFDLNAMLKRKDAIVQKLTDGVAFLLKRQKVTVYGGHGKLRAHDQDAWQVEIRGDDQNNTISARHVILAAGSKPRPWPGIAFDHPCILDSEAALSLDTVPQRLGIIGAGVIGLELGSVWCRLGAVVSILDGQSRLLPTADEAVSSAADALFRDPLQIKTDVKISDIQPGEKTVAVHYHDADGQKHTLTVERLLIAIGRVPNTDNLFSPALGLSCNEAGFIEVDLECKTNLPRVWAIGDLVRGPMLAHKASQEGTAVAERIAGQCPTVDYDILPWVIYTHPELACLGQTESQLQVSGIPFRKGQCPFSINGRALSLNETSGFVKMLSHAHTDRILGVHIVGVGASDLITEAVMAMAFSASAQDIAHIVHPHPSLSEAMYEAALQCGGRALHS